MYLSEALTPVSAHMLNNIWKKAAYRNQKMGITGYLCFSNGYFLQYLEGEAEDVEALMEEIKNDLNHNILYSVQNDNIPKRHFPNWTMELLKSKEALNFEVADYIISLIDNKQTNFDDAQKELIDELFWKHVSSVSNHNPDISYEGLVHNT